MHWRVCKPVGVCVSVGWRWLPGVCSSAYPLSSCAVLGICLLWLYQPRAPCLPLRPAGDLFTALLLGWLHKRPGELKAALEAAVAGLQVVLRDTVDKCGAAAAAEERTAAVSSARELRLVQNAAGILSPPLGQFVAEPID